MTTRKASEALLDEVVDSRPIKSLRPDAQIVQYEGKEGEECLRRIVKPDGTIYTFDGTKGNERRVLKMVTMKTTGHRRIYHYVGDKGQERVEKCVHENEQVSWYDGPGGSERKYMTVHKSGAVVHYEGPKDHEKRTKQVDKERVIFYGGARNQEYQKSVLHLLTGQVQHYKGSRNCERLHMSLDADGAMHWFNTANTNQQRLRSLYSDGTLVHWVSGHDPAIQVQQQHEKAKTTITAAQESLEQMQQRNECNEEVYRQVSNWYMRIHQDMSKLAAECKTASVGGLDRGPVSSSEEEDEDEEPEDIFGDDDEDNRLELVPIVSGDEY